MSRNLLYGGIAAAACGLFAVLVFPRQPSRPSSVAKAPAATLLPGDMEYASKPALAKAEYSDFINRNEASPDKKVQDRVGQARIKLAYLVGKEKTPAGRQNYAAARAILQQTVAKYKGEGLMNSDFGGIKDGAAYQAIVCLIGEHKNQEAAVELRRFLREYQLSPLVHAAHRRLARLTGGKSTAEDDALLQAAVSAQEKHIRQETAMCGPKCIVKLTELLPGPRTSGAPASGLRPLKARGPGDYQAIAKLCGTTEQGTTMEGMRKGLKVLGVNTFGFSLNRKDFARMPVPGILLSGQHYVVVLSVSKDSASIFDPAVGHPDTIPLPPLDTPEFSATVLLVSIPEVGE